MSRPLFLMRSTLVSAISAASLLATTAHAGPAAFTDARTFAMGGAGVASARNYAAPVKNPALLSVPHGEHQNAFGLLLPSLNARVAEDDILDNVDDAQDLWDELDAAVGGFNKTMKTLDAPSLQAAASDVADKASALNEKLEELDQSTVRADIGAGSLMALPGQRLGFGLFLNSSVRVAGITNYEDGETIRNKFINPARDIANGQTRDTLPDVDETLESNVEAVAIAVSEVGISLSHLFDIQGHPLAVGVSPKMMRIDTYHYGASVGDFDEDYIDADEYHETDTSFNLDLGFATQFGANNEWTAGLAIKNLIGRDIKTRAHNGFNSYHIEIEPKATLGLAHHSNWYTLALDVDLNKSKRTGLDGDTQFVAFGAELDLLHWAQLRAGVRHNLASDKLVSEDIEEKTLFTAGLGFTPFGMLLDISGMAGGNDYGASVQLGVMF